MQQQNNVSNVISHGVSDISYDAFKLIMESLSPIMQEKKDLQNKADTVKRMMERGYRVKVLA